MKIFGREPAFWIGVIMSLLSLAVSLGLKLTGSQVNLIETLLTSLLPLIAGLVIRQQVVPMEKSDALALRALAMPSVKPTQANLKTLIDDEKKEYDKQNG